MMTWTHDRNHVPASAQPLSTWRAIIVGLLGVAGAAVVVVVAAVITMIAVPILMITGTGRGSAAADRPLSESFGPVIDAEYEVVETPARADDGSGGGSRPST